MHGYFGQSFPMLHARKIDIEGIHLIHIIKQYCFVVSRKTCIIIKLSYIHNEHQIQNQWQILTIQNNNIYMYLLIISLWMCWKQNYGIIHIGHVWNKFILGHTGIQNHILVLIYTCTYTLIFFHFVCALEIWAEMFYNPGILRL